jgi:N-acetylneuraminic acid mutarotase
MKMKSTSQSGSLSLRAITILFCATALCSILIPTKSGLAFHDLQEQANDPQRTLTFEERVSYQRAIEDVYWRHRIWPKERKDPKPSLDAVMSQAQLEKKVSDYLRNSQALEEYWQRPITADQLQAEMDRMTRNTKQPEVLRELFEALGNDPFIIAECLARPALAQRLLTNWYGYDQRIHGGLKQRAETELQTHPAVEQMKRLSGKYSEIEFIKSDRAEYEGHRNPQHGLKLSASEWDDAVRKLAPMFDTIPHARARKGRPVAAAVSAAKSAQIKTGILSSLQEDAERFYATAVIEKTDNRLRVATVSWRKAPLESWLGGTQTHMRTAPTAPLSGYTLASIADGNCVDDTWRDISGPPDSRSGHSAVWTGSEMIIWGGFSVEAFNTGGRYNPATDDWTSTTVTNAPDVRFFHKAVWTGTEMIVWGGSFDDPIFGTQYVNTGGRYNPTTNSWLATSTTNAPDGRSSHTAVWTGNEMIVWGGVGLGDLNAGGKYNPGTDSWTTTSTSNAPGSRSGHTAVWTGSEMVVWGGYSFEIGDYLNTGGTYNPDTDSWTATSIANAPDSRDNHTAVWTGGDMIVWGGSNSAGSFNTGGRYDPITNSWTATTTLNAPDPRAYHTAVWTGNEMIVWGGFEGSVTNTGGKYNPATNSWTPTSTTNVPDSRYAHTAVWSGTEMIVWGGDYYDGNDHYLNTGGRYNPTSDSWVPTSTGNTPTGRYRHTGLWTGTEMIVWGGRTRDAGFLDTGGLYNPGIDAWMPTNITNAPSGRAYHTAVWTGSEMIVWGGFANPSYLNTGGRYNPSTNSWTATSTTNAPIGRWFHTAVWTGNKMAVWGGSYNDGSSIDYLNSGGRYDPTTDSWTTTSTTNAPTGRDEHVAVWTGDEMIVWGGYFYDGNDHYFNTGGRYNPEMDTWVATSTSSAPSARSVPETVWTGDEMIVWGGYGNAGYVNTGGRFSPSANRWTATSTSNAPIGRAGHSLIWTGDKVIVWGGLFFDGDYHFLNDGGRYDPTSNNWTDVSIIDAPSPRDLHAAVWTGNEMIIWGGLLFLNVGSGTGGIYCAQSGPTPTPSPTPTPTPCVGRCEPTPRPHPTPHIRPTPH